MHDADARHLYVDVAEPLAERAVRARIARRLALRMTRREPAVHSARSIPTSAAAACREAEPQLEKELRSGYRVVVTFESRGEAERARYNLNRLDARFLGEVWRRRTRRSSSTEAPLERRLRLARAAARA